MCISCIQYAHSLLFCRQWEKKWLQTKSNEEKGSCYQPCIQFETATISKREDQKIQEHQFEKKEERKSLLIQFPIKVTHVKVCNHGPEGSDLDNWK